MRKKFFAAIFLIGCLFMFSGCTDTDIKQRDSGMTELIIGSDEYEPFFYIDENGKFSGIDVELSKEACKRLGYKPVFKQISWDEKDKLLENEEIDCIWGSFTMTGREDEYLWAGPYLKTRQVVMVKSSSGIYKLDDLKNKSVAVQMDSKPEEIFLKKNGNNSEFIPKLKDVYTFVTIDEAVDFLRKDYSQAVSAHESVLIQYENQEKGVYRILDDEIMEAGIGVAFKKKGNKMLSDALTDIFKDMSNDGTIKKIVEKYGLDADKVLCGGKGNE